MCTLIFPRSKHLKTRHFARAVRLTAGFASAPRRRAGSIASLRVRLDVLDGIDLPDVLAVHVQPFVVGAGNHHFKVLGCGVLTSGTM